MKRKFTLPVSCFICVKLLLLAQPAVSQLNNSGFHARFGVDADTKTDYIKFGSTAGVTGSDDWFSTSGGSIGVIDTTNSNVFRTNLIANFNPGFSKRMSVPLYYKANNTMWIDAVYSRDYYKKDSTTPDLSAFVSQAGNLDDPAIWKGGPSDVATKTDFIDVFAHMRRNGTNIKDSLWFFTASSTLGTTGSRYFDIELYKNRLSYNQVSGVFSTGGINEGHTEWRFDALGRVTQTGDMIIGVTYSPGNAPVIEVRLWVARTTVASVVPQFFNFGTSFDSYSNRSLYGYNNIVSKTGSTAFGSGAGNYSATSSDTTYSTPWGTTTSIGWSQNYQSLQLVEIGINLSRIGVDPALYSTLGNTACGAYFNSILFKSRSSASFSSNLIDFVGPLNFISAPNLDYLVTGDTLTCANPTGIINVTSRTTAGAYTWRSLSGGGISASSTDSSVLNITRAGKYVLSGSVATGCPITRRDTITVLADSLTPVATARAGSNQYAQIQLFGGDTILSNYSTPFGGSKGLTWSWTGPSMFTSTEQNPLTYSGPGTYTLTVTEKRNGCTSTASTYLNFSMLVGNYLVLSGSYKSGSNELKWTHTSPELITYYEVQRSAPDGSYYTIGKVSASAGSVSGSNQFVFTDKQVVNGKYSYRLKANLKTGQYGHSNAITLAVTGQNENAGYIVKNGSTGKLYLVVERKNNAAGQLALYDVSGKLLSYKTIQLQKGINQIEVDLPGNSLHYRHVIISLQSEGNYFSRQIYVD